MMAEEQLTIKQKAVLKGWELYYGNASVSTDEGFEATARKAIELVLKKVEEESLDIENGTYKRLWSQRELLELKRECLK